MAEDSGRAGWPGQLLRHGERQKPIPAYNGRQAYIISATVSGGKISSAVVGLVAGGKDFEIVRNMCKKYDLDPEAS